MPSEEEMRLFLKLGRRLHILDTVLVNRTKTEKLIERETWYRNYNAVHTLAYFVEWLHLRDNIKEKDSFTVEMETMSNESLRDYIRDKALDYYEILVESSNSNFGRAMVRGNRKRIQEEKNERIKRSIWYHFWPIMTSGYTKWFDNVIDDVINIRREIRLNIAQVDYVLNGGDGYRINGAKNIFHAKFDKIVGTRKIVYFHGFGSSSLGSTVTSLQELLPEFTVIAQDIDVDPQKALVDLIDLCDLEEPELVVGTSLGGMYAQQMRGFKRICINPAFNLSQHKDILHEGTFEFLNTRLIGETTFTITPEIIQHFAEMEAHQFDGITDDDKEHVYGLFADNDTTVNCEDIFRQHFKNVIHFHGEHRLNREVIEEVLVPLIKEITNK